MAPAAPDILAPESRAALGQLGSVDVVAGVHALRRATEVARLLDTVESGLAKHFPSHRTAVLVADAGSHDATPDVLRAWCAAPQRGPARGYVEPAPPLHHGRAVQALLAAGHELGARGIAVLDADMSGVSADWLSALIDPVIEDRADYVSPSYSRSASEGTLTTNLLAPLTRALYGKRIQQITGGCSALAAPFALHCLETGVAGNVPHAHGTEIALTTAALASSARVFETHLGRRLVDPILPQLDLATTLVRTVGPVFDLMERYRDAWAETRGSAALSRRGETPAVVPDGERPSIERMVHAFGLGMKDLLPVWEQIMPEATLARLYPLTLLEPEDFEFRPALWARVVMDFAVAHHERKLPRDHLLRSLTPLYLGRVAAFLKAAWASRDGLAGIFDQLGEAFEAEKDDLGARWR